MVELVLCFLQKTLKLVVFILKVDHFRLFKYGLYCDHRLQEIRVENYVFDYFKKTFLIE